MQISIGKTEVRERDTILYAILIITIRARLPYTRYTQKAENSIRIIYFTNRVILPRTHYRWNWCILQQAQHYWVIYIYIYPIH